MSINNHDHDEVEGGFSRLLGHASWSVAQILDAYAAWIAVGVCGAFLCAIAVRNGGAPVPAIEVPAKTPTISRAPTLLETGRKFFEAEDFPTAVSCYSDIINDQYSQAEILPALINRAVAYTRLEKFTKSLDDLTRASQLVSAFPELNAWEFEIELRAAQTLCLAGDYDSAISVLNRLAAVPNKPTTVLTLRATALSKKLDFHGAVRDLSRILNNKPTADAFINRAAALHSLQNYSLALADTKRASEILIAEDNQAESELRTYAAINHCLSLHAAGMHGEAVAVATELLEDQIAVPQMHLIRAASLRLLGNEEEAMIDERLAASFARNPQQDQHASDSDMAQNPHIKSAPSEVDKVASKLPVCQSVSDGEFAIALQIVSDSPAEIPEQETLKIDGLVELAMNRVAERDPGDAVAILERHLSFFPKDDEARVRRVAILLDMNDLTEATRDLDILIEANDQDLTVQSLRGLTYSRRSDFDAAIESFSSAIRLSENDPLGYFNRGTVYFSKGEWNLAASDFQRAIHHGDGSSTTHSWLGRALAKKRQFAEAIVSHDLAIAKTPSASAYKSRGLTHLESGASEKALADFTASLDASPNDTSVLVLRTRLLLESERYEDALSDAKSLADLQRGDQTAINLVQRLEAQVAQSQQQKKKP